MMSHVHRKRIDFFFVCVVAEPVFLFFFLLEGIDDELLYVSMSRSGALTCLKDAVLFFFFSPFSQRRIWQWVCLAHALFIFSFSLLFTTRPLG